MSNPEQPSQPYRNEEAGLRARLEELEQQALRRAERLEKVRERLATKGWVPRAAAARRSWALAFMVLVAVLLMVAGHLLLFRTPDEVEIKVKPVRVVPYNHEELRSLRKQHRRLMNTLGALHGIHYKIHHGRWRLELAQEFLVLDGDRDGEARVLVAGWACRQGRWDLHNKINKRLTAAQWTGLARLCVGK